MDLLKPTGLRQGSLLAVVSPASTPQSERVAAGVVALKAMGFRVRVMPHALARGPMYYAGTAAQRAADLMDAFADTEVDGIVCTRGGYGSAELLPLLSAAVVRANRKPFLGYSDLTSVHTWLHQRCGLVSFHGPMVAADFARPHGVDADSWWAALGGGGAAARGNSSPAAAGNYKMTSLQAGTAEGPLLGGCASILCAGLGTEYALDVPKGAVLFLEDVGVRAYQWDRMLLQMDRAGWLDAAAGIIFGDMTQSCAAAELPLLREALLHRLRGFGGPVVVGLRSGHVDGPNITLPLGVGVRLDAEDAANPGMHFLEAAVCA